MLKQHISEFLRHDTLAKSALKSAVVHALLRDPLVGPEEEREPLEFRTFFKSSWCRDDDDMISRFEKTFSKGFVTQESKVRHKTRAETSDIRMFAPRNPR